MFLLHMLPSRPLHQVELPKVNAPTAFCEELESVLTETPVSEVQAFPFVTVSPYTSVRSAVSLMADRNIACLIVAEEGELRGIFTERDVLNKVADRMEDSLDRPLSEVMTAKPMYVFETDNSAAALCVMVAYGYRHVPVVNSEMQVVGVVSPQRMLSFLRRQWVK